MNESSSSAEQPHGNSAAELETQAGVFVIPPESSTPGDDLRSGATVADWAEDEPTSQERDELPMVVWLRGDEPWYPQFDLDADAVMAKLGIKRSRLTQISGKDLRVGRVRVDRYIKPIFRSADVETYLAWTRATASHQKSSSALKDAALVLQSQSEQMAQVVSRASTEFSEALKNGLLIQLEEAATRSVMSLAESVKQLQHQFEQALSRSCEESKRHLDIFSTQLTAQDLRFDALENAMAATSLRLAELSDRQLQAFERQEAGIELLARCVEALELQQEQIGRLLKPAAKLVRRKQGRKFSQTCLAESAHSVSTVRKPRPSAQRRKPWS